MFGYWEFQGPSLKQAPPGHHISSPAACFFGIALIQNKTRRVGRLRAFEANVAVRGPRPAMVKVFKSGPQPPSVCRQLPHRLDQPAAGGCAYGAIGRAMLLVVVGTSLPPWCALLDGGRNLVEEKARQCGRRALAGIHP